MSNAQPDGAGQALNKDNSRGDSCSPNTPSRKTSTRRPARLAEPIKIAEWWRNRSGTSIRITLTSFEGHNLVDVRSWFTKDGRLLPGKGFSANVRHLPQLAKEIARALEKARELGLIDDESDGS